MTFATSSASGGSILEPEYRGPCSSKWARRDACHAVDISPQGAKVSPQVPLRSGTEVRLQFVQPDGPLLHLGAVVWRVDADGLAFLLARNFEHEVMRKA